MSVQKQVRTTISLPEDLLSAAKRVAKSRHVNLSTVVAEALDEAMKRCQTRKERAEEILARYEKAFGGFSEEELMVLSGINLEEKR